MPPPRSSYKTDRPPPPFLPSAGCVWPRLPPFLRESRSPVAAGPLERVRKPSTSRPRKSLLLLNFFWPLICVTKVYLFPSGRGSSPQQGGKPGNHTTSERGGCRPQSPALPSRGPGWPPSHPPPGPPRRLPRRPLTLYRSLLPFCLSITDTTLPPVLSLGGPLEPSKPCPN